MTNIEALMKLADVVFPVLFVGEPVAGEAGIVNEAPDFTAEKD